MRVVPRKSLVEARPVELWHLEIAQDEVVRFGAQLLQGGAAVGRDVHAVVVEPEKIRQRLRDVGLIVHHEDRLALNRRQGLERPCFRKSRRYGDRQLDAKDRALSRPAVDLNRPSVSRSEEHTSELQSQSNLVCRLLLEKKKTRYMYTPRCAGARKVERSIWQTVHCCGAVSTHCNIKAILQE